MFNPTLKAANLNEFNLEQYQELVSKLSQIDVEHIDSELRDFPAYYSYYHGLMIRTKREFDGAVVTLELFKSHLANSKRLEVSLSVAAMNDYLNAQTEVRDLNKEILNKEEIYGLVKSICQTLEHKKDMLVQLSANRRMETKLYN